MKKLATHVLYVVLLALAGLAVFVLFALVMPSVGYAQTTCQRYENAGLSWTYEGTQAGMCESIRGAYEAAYPALAPMTVGTCGANQVTLIRSSNGVTYLVSAYDGGACQGEPEPDPDPEPQPAECPASPFLLTYEQGTAISLAIVAVWLLAWSLRAVNSTLSDDGDSKE